VFSQVEVRTPPPVVLLGNSPWKALFPNTIRSARGAHRQRAVHRHRRARAAPEPGNLGGADDFAIIPYGTHEKIYGKPLKGSAKVTAGQFNPARPAPR
jgi:hypothetical protein